MRYLTAGESHGPALCAIIEGMPANLRLNPHRIDKDLRRRQQGYGRGGRMKIESDRAEIFSGLRFGRTLGSPLAIRILNRDYDNWQSQMSPEGDEPAGLPKITRPRPGHADLSGALKYQLSDVRDVLERASARETAVRVAVGAVAKELLTVFDIEVFSWVRSIGSVNAITALPADIKGFFAAAEASPVRCPDDAATAAMMAAIDEAKAAGDSLGGVFEVAITGAPVGLGSHAHWDRKLDARLAAALMSIQAVKGVEIGGGFALAALPGSGVHDEIFYDEKRGYYRKTNRAGGIEGGISNGETLLLRVAVKPIPTLYQPLRSVDMKDHSAFAAAVERSDTCAVPAAAVVGEAVAAWEIALALREKLGGDSLQEMQNSLAYYRNCLAGR